MPAEVTVGDAKPFDHPTQPSAPLSEHDQLDAAMQKLIRVSSQFKDLSGQDRNVSTREETIAMMEHYLQRLGLADAVQKLSVIHVAGTKGKGSTCAMTERILRDAGYKTGLFTSPHLVSACERFRINGKPISERKFLDHFNTIWEGLEKTAHQSDDYPPMAWFFRFLTLMALHLFLKEEVDVVILEVGLGGRLDATNVIKRPVVCGITTLDLDHTRVLGATMDKIAYAKGGILKPDVPAFSVAQESLAMETLNQCAVESHTTLQVLPTLDSMGPDGAQCTLGMQGDYQRVNAALAVALSSTWLAARGGQPVALQSALTAPIRAGLKNAFWPARAHVMRDPTSSTAYYIDGAHTLRSLECCGEWFHQSLTAKPSAKRALIFTIHHERNVASMIHPLLQLHFDRVYFCPTSSFRPSLAKVLTFSEALQSAELDHVLAHYSAEAIAARDAADGPLKWQLTLSYVWEALQTHLRLPDGTPFTASEVVQVKDSVADCVDALRAATCAHDPASSSSSDPTWNVLVTGSLYLAGEVLDLLHWQE
ncbi:TPA: hypothetical protein N0F65_002447 [Lagenidium giganteum]|uniref:tetrahydrofolate synthase n=1 Tax=Lagenidium giganteum TaxID=4803 RepID=A0AAV2YHW2_9STRA|nr:TPA: hypothetical protein N0F65_002447 [Lagenidium giganteum]